MYAPDIDDSAGSIAHSRGEADGDRAERKQSWGKISTRKGGAWGLRVEKVLTVADVTVH